MESLVAKNTIVAEEEKESLAVEKPTTHQPQLEQIIRSLKQYLCVLILMNRFEQPTSSDPNVLYDESMAAAVSTVLRINLRNLEQRRNENSE